MKLKYSDWSGKLNFLTLGGFIAGYLYQRRYTFFLSLLDFFVPSKWYQNYFHFESGVSPYTWCANCGHSIRKDSKSAFCPICRPKCET